MTAQPQSSWQSSADVMIRLDHIGKQFKGQVVVKDLSLDIRRGQTTVLLGPSGCSKSTLIRIMIGLLQPDQGQVIIDGAPLSPATIKSVRQRMGYVIQEGGLFPHLTAYDNAALMPRHLGWREERISRRIGELVALTQLPPSAMDRYPMQLSGGQRQRISLVRALMLDPDILLLDEPLGALDPMIRADLQQDLGRIFRVLEKTVVLVTHDLGEAAQLADHVVIMREGSILQQGSMADLVWHPADPFVSKFIAAQRPPKLSGEVM